MTAPPRLPQPLPAPFMNVDLPLADRRAGKVRISYSMGDEQRLFLTTDRLSAFDRIIAGVPYKGQVLNQLAAWWFARTEHIVANHVISTPDPNSLVARSAQTLPVEVVARGYITGVTTTSLWRRYAEGARVIDGHTLPDGIRKNTVLPQAIITPTTKEFDGGHDQPLSCAEVAERGLVEPQLWERVQAAALELFATGQRLAAGAGLILADTKYEFGLTADGELLLIDEMHTPDSSRLWVADSYEDRLSAGEEPESLDKEVVRRALLEAGYGGEGEIPMLSDNVWAATAARYVNAFERLTGEAFVPGDYPVEERLAQRCAEGAFA